jgi:hypothetical protein
MWRVVGIFLAALSAASAQTIGEFTLDAKKITELPVSHEVTAVTLPGPITAIAGADMLIDNGSAAAVEVEDGTPLRFHVTHVKGSNFFLVQSLQPETSGTLTVIFESSAYVLALRTVAANPVASAIFKRGNSDAVAVKVDHPPEPVRFSPRIALGVLDRARAYPVLAKSLPRAVEGVTLRAQGRKVELPDVEINVQEVYRFSKEDALVFLLSLHNKTDGVLEIAPSTFAARVGNERFEQSIANGPRVLGPGQTAEAEFAIVGLPDGTRNDLSADNAFTILVNTTRRAPPAATAASASAPTQKEAPQS